MNIVDEQIIKLPRTGYDNIDYSYTQEAGATDYIKYKQLVDPIDTKLLSSVRSTMAQPGQAIASEWDIWTVASAYSIDSYIRTAVDKYIHLVSKEGWRIRGANKAATEYINQRLRVLKLSSGRSFQQTLFDIEYNIILFANSFLVKVPFKGNNPIPGLKIQQVGKNKIIGGYFSVHPGMMQPKIDDKGQLTDWAYMVSGSERRVFKAEEILHIAFNKPSNVLYGQPFFLPVLEDIRTYRQLEWQVVMLINRYLHPLIHVIKGLTPDGKWTGAQGRDPNAIATTDALIKSVSPDGLLVTGPDVSISVKGVESQAIRAEGYLDIWRKRIFAGLAVSDIAMGEGTAGTRATADAITAEMHDMAKALQKTIAEAVNNEIIFPMLLEGGFDPIVNEDESHFEYNEIALDELIKRRTEVIAEWQNNLITETEAREAIGKEAMDDAGRATTLNSLYKADAQTMNGSKGPEAKATATKLQPANKNGQKSSPKGKVVKK